MKNLKKLIVILSLSSIALIGCSNSIEETTTHEPDQNIPTTPPGAGVVGEKIVQEADRFIVHSNHVIPMDYFDRPEQYVQEDFDIMQTRDELDAQSKIVESIEVDVIDDVSNQLGDKPHLSKNSDLQITELQAEGIRGKSVLSNLPMRDITILFIIDKHIDDYMNTNHPIENVTNLVEQLSALEDNLNNAEHMADMVISVFDNEQYIVYLAPSHKVIGYGEFNADVATQNMKDYAEYFKSSDVKSIFETYLGE